MTGPSRRLDVALAIVRVVVGVVFMAHGAQKLFVYGFDGVATAFQQMGIPGAAVVAPAVALIEFVGGTMLLLGLSTGVAATALSVVMAGALFFVHLPNGFFLPQGIEFALTLLAANIALALLGAGAYSLDAWLGTRRSDWITEHVTIQRPA